MDDIRPPRDTMTHEEPPHRADFLRSWKWIVASTLVVILVIAGTMIAAGLSPVGGMQNTGGAQTVVVKIAPGEGFLGITASLSNAHLLRSRLAFEIAAFLNGSAFHVQTGTYRLSPAMSGMAILHALAGGAPTVTVTIPEGSNLYEIDKTLADAGVISRGDLINFKDYGNLEGKLFPDTYQFYEGSDIADVIQKFSDNFDAKAEPLLAADPKNAAQDLILASVLEKEAPDPRDESIIAGIVKKRLADGMRLQIDATVCYAEQMTMPMDVVDCSALTRIDFTSGSPYNSDYNTYLHAGLPPGPIGSPGIAAITAALHPASSPYLYYINDPTTGKVIYAATLAEQNVNIKKYLGN